MLRRSTPSSNRCPVLSLWFQHKLLQPGKPGPLGQVPPILCPQWVGRPYSECHDAQGNYLPTPAEAARYQEMAANNPTSVMLAQSTPEQAVWVSTPDDTQATMPAGVLFDSGCQPGFIFSEDVAETVQVETEPDTGSVMTFSGEVQTLGRVKQAVRIRIGGVSAANRHPTPEQGCLTFVAHPLVMPRAVAARLGVCMIIGCAPAAAGLFSVDFLRNVLYVHPLWMSRGCPSLRVSIPILDRHPLLPPQRLGEDARLVQFEHLLGVAPGFPQQAPVATQQQYESAQHEQQLRRQAHRQEGRQILQEAVSQLVPGPQQPTVDDSTQRELLTTVQQATQAVQSGLEQQETKQPLTAKLASLQEELQRLAGQLQDISLGEAEAQHHRRLWNRAPAVACLRFGVEEQEEPAPEPAAIEQVVAAPEPVAAGQLAPALALAPVPPLFQAAPALALGPEPAVAPTPSQLRPANLPPGNPRSWSAEQRRAFQAHMLQLADAMTKAVAGLRERGSLRPRTPPGVQPAPAFPASSDSCGGTCGSEAERLSLPEEASQASGSGEGATTAGEQVGGFDDVTSKEAEPLPAAHHVPAARLLGGGWLQRVWRAGRTMCGTLLLFWAVLCTGMASSRMGISRPSAATALAVNAPPFWVNFCMQGCNIALLLLLALLAIMQPRWFGHARASRRTLAALVPCVVLPLSLPLIGVKHMVWTWLEELFGTCQGQVACVLWVATCGYWLWVVLATWRQCGHALAERAAAK